MQQIFEKTSQLSLKQSKSELQVFPSQKYPLVVLHLVVEEELLDEFPEVLVLVLVVELVVVLVFVVFVVVLAVLCMQALTEEQE